MQPNVQVLVLLYTFSQVLFCEPSGEDGVSDSFHGQASLQSAISLSQILDDLIDSRRWSRLAAAKIEALAFKVALIPALEMEMVCCSMTSWMAVLSLSSILSNSSIQQIPLSASTKAPPSKTISSVTGSLNTAAVKPTPEEPRPTLTNGFEPRVGNREKDPRDIDQITWVHRSDQFTVDLDIDGSWDMPRWDLGG
ncbi:hypothetical protein WICPIJ_002446 [Wickerhamomyces pijperi]|uniref:Uncharacterized protein n=1 Tax=Wickerhamomyces pijperi TaxID=599730 RepID=A0A9P8Q9M8_WICPI|nr:hypothetical protein WICPIJ_002446 [Wickerhamomyces pijperi]